MTEAEGHTTGVCKGRHLRLPDYAAAIQCQPSQSQERLRMNSSYSPPAVTKGMPSTLRPPAGKTMWPGALRCHFVPAFCSMLSIWHALQGSSLQSGRAMIYRPTLTSLPLFILLSILYSRAPSGFRVAQML